MMSCPKSFALDVWAACIACGVGGICRGEMEETAAYELGDLGHFRKPIWIVSMQKFLAGSWTRGRQGREWYCALVV